MKKLMHQNREDSPVLVHEWISMRFGPKAKLRNRAEALHNKTFSREEANINVFALAGRSCQIRVVHKTDGDKIKTLVDTAMATPKGVKVPAPTAPILLYSLQAPKEEVFNQLPDWIQQRIIEVQGKAQARVFDNITKVDDDVPY